MTKDHVISKQEVRNAFDFVKYILTRRDGTAFVGLKLVQFLNDH